MSSRPSNQHDDHRVLLDPSEPAHVEPEPAHVEPDAAHVEPGQQQDQRRPGESAPPSSPVRTVSWPVFLIAMSSRAVLIALVSMALWGVVPVVLGWHPTTVMTGSMMPRLHVGDVAVSRPLHGQAPTLGSVLLFDDPDHPDRLRLHRFVAVDPDGRLVTRGDANPENDSSPIGLPAVQGVGTLRIPYIGLPIVWLRTGEWVKLGLVVVALAGLIVMSGRAGPSSGPNSGLPAARERRPRQPRASRSDPGRPPGPSERSRIRIGRAGTAVAITVSGALVIGVSQPAAALFTDTTTTSASVSALPYFTCSAAVAGSTPYLYYRMDETSSTTTSATDSSGSNRTGVYGSAGKTSRATRACTRDTGSAMTYNGSTGYLSSPLYNTAPPNVFTLSIWFKTTTTSGGKLIGWGNQQTGASGIYDRHLYMTNSGAVIFGLYPGGVRTISSADGLNDNKWHQAVATLSSGGQVLYVDGVQVAIDTNTTTGESSSSGYWRIGYDNIDGWTSTPTSRFFAGTLDDAAVYLSALNATTVRNLYLAGT